MLIEHEAGRRDFAGAWHFSIMEKWQFASWLYVVELLALRHRSRARIPITALPFSARCRNALLKMGAKTAGGVSKITQEKMLATAGFGHRSLKETYVAMSAIGYDVRGGTPLLVERAHALRAAVIEDLFGQRKTRE